MNMRRILFLSSRWFLVLAAAVALAGCEQEGGEDPDTEDIDDYFEEHPYVSDPRSSENPRDVSVDPDSATVSFVGQRVSFRAQGGEGGYTWDVANTARGAVEVRTDSDAVYVASVVGPNTVIVYDRRGHSAIASINGPVSQLLATADPTTLEDDGDLAVLRASGGAPTYHWSVSDSAVGDIVPPAEGESVIYKRYHAGDNSITVVDSLGNSYSLVVQQP